MLDEIVEQSKSLNMNSEIMFNNSNHLLSYQSVTSQVNEESSEYEGDFYLIGKCFYLQAELLKINGDMQDKGMMLDYYASAVEYLKKYDGKSMAYLEKPSRLIPYEWFKKHYKP